MDTKDEYRIRVNYSIEKINPDLHEDLQPVAYMYTTFPYELQRENRIDIANLPAFKNLYIDDDYGYLIQTESGLLDELKKLTIRSQNMTSFRSFRNVNLKYLKCYNNFLSSFDGIDRFE